MPLRAFLDANVLYPFTLRDALLRSAEQGFFQPYWSERVLDETVRNLVVNNVMPVERARILRAALCEAFPESMADGYEGLIPRMRNHRGDRHVAAAAKRCEAKVIVTGNLKHFRRLPAGLVAKSPDEFLSSLFRADPDGMTDVLVEQAAAYRKPVRLFGELLNGLAKTVPDFVDAVRNRTK